MSATLSASRSVAIEPMVNGFGAHLNGIDFDRLDATLGAALNEALNRHGVLFYRPPPGVAVTNDQFVDLAATMGDVIRYPYRRGENYPDERLGKIDTDARAINRFGTSLWHTDGTSEECPPQAALLSPEELPTQGGDTMWADMVRAYEALSPSLRGLVDGLEALHTTAIPAKRSGEPEVYGKGSEFVHPVVLTDPASGRRMLYVNEHYTQRVIGLSEAESASLLRMLYNHTNTPEFHVRWQWRLHDIVIWEERLTQHRAVADFHGARVLRRAAIKGERPR